MGLINEPVADCKIVFKYLYWTPDRKGKQYYHDQFETIPALRAYFQRFPSAGALVGYGKAPTGSSFAFEAILILEWANKTSIVSKEFRNVSEFTRFLRENPELARCLKYEPNP